MSTAEASRIAILHPRIVRSTHWINAIAIFVMIGSGWRIYNNDPIFSWINFPLYATIGGDPDITYKLNGDAGFSNALLWHFAAMWLLVINGVVYVVYGIASGRFLTKLLPISLSETIAAIRETLRLKLGHEDISIYNPVQKLLYIGILCTLALIVLSGLAIWKPVQFQVLTVLFGGFQGARLVHFLCMSAISGFILIHVSLALLVPSTLAAMITGRARVPVASRAPYIHPAE